MWWTLQCMCEVETEQMHENYFSFARGDTHAQKCQYTHTHIYHTSITHPSHIRPSTQKVSQASIPLSSSHTMLFMHSACLLHLSLSLSVCPAIWQAARSPSDWTYYSAQQWMQAKNQTGKCARLPSGSSTGDDDGLLLLAASAVPSRRSFTVSPCSADALAAWHLCSMLFGFVGRPDAVRAATSRKQSCC